MKTGFLKNKMEPEKKNLKKEKGTLGAALPFLLELLIVSFTPIQNALDNPQPQGTLRFCGKTYVYPIAQTFKSQEVFVFSLIFNRCFRDLKYFLNSHVLGAERYRLH